MANATKFLAVTTVIGLCTSLWLYRDNRALEVKLANQPAAAAKDSAERLAASSADPWIAPEQRSGNIRTGAMTPEPSLPAQKKEHRLDRRQRKMDEFAAMFGRHEGETDQEYKDRMGPLISAGLLVPRTRAADNRRIAEERAGVTPEQSAKLDQALEKVYGDVIDYTNKAVADGALSPYERNVAGWLDYAGGLGGILNETQTQVIGKILSSEQVKAMQASGFEWGEYLGFSAPWEKLAPPPPRN